eukprot:scaffold8681_cov200-Amphora_coffeaeformis.AAC.2
MMMIMMTTTPAKKRIALRQARLKIWYWKWETTTTTTRREGSSSCSEADHSMTDVTAVKGLRTEGRVGGWTEGQMLSTFKVSIERVWCILQQVIALHIFCFIIH